MSNVRLTLTRILVCGALSFATWSHAAVDAIVTAASDQHILGVPENDRQTLAQLSTEYQDNPGQETLGFVYPHPPPRMPPPHRSAAPAPVVQPKPLFDEDAFVTEHEHLDIPNYFLETKEAISDCFDALYSTWLDEYVLSNDYEGLIGLVVLEGKTTALIVSGFYKPFSGEGTLLPLVDKRVMTVIALALTPFVVEEVGTSLVAL
ncbi:hypothetical protein [Paraburkholderia sp. HD33-4]|uniref:hypothetical protein n=1 Tax=Paraburkholderia sp. HD33-4 TaxID=2883242 RepID=UPI001F461E67|nr:hypothetical protein [Paraburkholderia sp. HD33-4]